MGIFKTFPALLCVAVAISGVSAGKITVTQSSSATCKVSSISSSKSESVSVAADAAADATAYICGDDVAAEAVVDVLAEATARAAATAVAKVTADCYATGNGSFKVNGRSLASAAAYAYAEAYAEAVVDASVCNKCTAAAEFIGSSWEEIFLEAVAEAEVNLEGSANGGSIKQSQEVFVEAVAEATVTAYARVLASAKASVDKGCDGSIVASIITGDIENPNEIECVIVVAGKDESFAQNAVVEAVAEAEAYACEGLAFAQAEVAARAVAHAIARAISEVLINCFVEGNGFACALGNADIKTVVSATATAWARGYAKAISECDKCANDAEVIVDAAAKIMAEAASSAYNEVCIGDNEYFSEDVIEKDIAAASITAIAKVIVEAVVNDGECDANVEAEVETKVCTECVGKWRKCGGSRIDKVKGCCDENFSCIKRNDRYMQCRRNGRKIPRRWDGSVVDCEQ